MHRSARDYFEYPLLVIDDQPRQRPPVFVTASPATLGSFYFIFLFLERAL